MSELEQFGLTMNCQYFKGTTTIFNVRLRSRCYPMDRHEESELT